MCGHDVVFDLLLCAKIHFIMTGDCTMLESWSLDERYFRLAESTGGQVVVTQRWQKAVNIFDALLKQLIGKCMLVRDLILGHFTVHNSSLFNYQHDG